MKLNRTLVTFLLLACATAGAQVVPDTTGPIWPPVSGMLSYSLSYSQMALFYGGTEGNAVTSSLSGELTYANENPRRPFTLAYSGGDTWDLVGGSGIRGYFQHLSASQGIVGRNWALNIRDSVSLRPEYSYAGFSGIPGIGTLPSDPGSSTQTVLTQNTQSLDNTTTGNFSRSLNAMTNLGFNGSYAILRFPNGDGLETNQLQFGPHLTRRLNAFTSLTGTYSYSRYTYPQSGVAMITQSLLASCQRSWGRRLTTSASVGPEWVQASSSAGLPASTNLSISAHAAYSVRRDSYSLTYSRSVMGGAGALTEYGNVADNVSADYARQMTRYMSLSVMATYERIHGLQSGGVTSSNRASASLSRKLGRYFSASANYSAMQQSSSAALSANALSGIEQTITLSIRYFPRGMRFEK